MGINFVAFALLQLVSPSRSLAAACSTDIVAVRQPPAVLSPQLSARYPNGIEVSLTAHLDAENKAKSVDFADLKDGHLTRALTKWAQAVTYAPQDKGCTPKTQSADLSNVDFYPAASGAIGHPQIVDGIDFDDMSYTNGPGNCATSHMKNGTYSYPGEVFDASVEDVFAGTIAGRPTAIVILRCEYNGHGFDQVAQLFDISGGKAQRLGIIGSGGMNGPDSPLPPWPGGWIHSSYADGKLYADVWDYEHKCDKKRDWISSAYTVRNGKLVLLNTLHHHRAGLGVYCGG